MAFSLNPSLQDQLPQLAKKLSDILPVDVPEHIRECLSKKNGKESYQETLRVLLHLLSPDIQKYVEDAFAQAWPFLPPTINPTIMKEQNAHILKLSQVELLLLCLNFAIESENYQMALSIAFVVDRFVYWCDGSAALLNIVDQIKKLAPMIPVAPQLAIRKARVMKDNGDLHGSIQILNNLIEQKFDDSSTGDSLQRWQYKAEYQYINVCAVCVQIKGQIYHNLGLWKDAIGPLMNSIEGFQALPVEDLKGTSYSYALLSRCLCRLSRREYHELCEQYSFQYDHHFYQAYEIGMVAYKQSPGQRLFLSKHLLQSGECLLMYTVQLTDASLQYDMFKKILEILNSVYYNQNVEEYSQSKDQLFLFIKALFVTCLTLGCSYNPLDRDLGNYLETICLFVYKKFCDIGANQLDSEIGERKLAEIIPALNFALITVSQEFRKLSYKSTVGDTSDGFSTLKSLEKNLPVDLKESIDCSSEQNVTRKEFLQTRSLNANLKVNNHQEDVTKMKSEKVCKQINSEMDDQGKSREMKKDCEAESHEKVTKPGVENLEVDLKTGTQEKDGTPRVKIAMVDYKADTKERVVTPGKQTPMVDCESDTKERLVTPENVIPMVDCKAVTKERLVTPGKVIPMVDCESDTKERLVTPGNVIPMVDCEVDTKERLVTPGKVIPMVDCEADTKERLVTPENVIPMVDCESDTKERLVTPGNIIPMVDCKADTKERLVTPGNVIPMVDCEADTKERLVTPGNVIPMVDCEADTKERLVTPGDFIDTKERLVTPGNIIPMVDCEADTKERLVTPGKVIPVVDCDADTKERLVTPGKVIPMVDCEVDTKERLVTPGNVIPMIDCKADTKERLVTPGNIIPMVDCEADTKERLVTPGNVIPMVDCEADTKERLVTPGNVIPMVDCESDTKERLVTPGNVIPMVDCEADTKEMVVTPGDRPLNADCKAATKIRLGTPGESKPIIDCEADTLDRVYTGASTNIIQPSSNFDSGFESMGCSFPEENRNSMVKPRIVGLPSDISAIQSKISSLDKFYCDFDDSLIDTNSSAVESKDTSLVNTSALTSIRQSRKDGTFLANRLLNKFQRQESLIAEPQFNIPTVGDVNQGSLSSFLGNLLLKHLPPSIFPSEIRTSLPVFNWEDDSADQEEMVNKIQKATLYQYNPVTCVWSGQDTIVCTGKELTLGKGKKGNFRNVYQINFLHQDEPLGKYVSKRYRQQKEPLQYMDDVVSQMQAGLYVNLFNRALRAYESDLRIYFLTAAYMLLHDSQGKVQDWMNIEPFVDGEFLKLTNNYDFCDPRGKKVSTSFTHFTYVQSCGKMMVSDLQGWLPSGTQNLIYLTDPQFHTDSGDSSPFDFGMEGMKVFFDVVHPECNEICKTLMLERPNL